MHLIIDIHTTYGVCEICNGKWSHITKACSKYHDNAKPYKHYICLVCAKSNEDKRDDNQVELDIQCHTRLNNLTDDEDPQLYTIMYDGLQTNMNIRDIIQQCLGIGITQAMDFQKRVQSYEWLSNTLGYCRWNKNANLMKFQHPIHPFGLRTDNQYTEFKPSQLSFLCFLP